MPRGVCQIDEGLRNHVVKEFKEEKTLVLKALSFHKKSPPRPPPSCPVFVIYLYNMPNVQVNGSEESTNHRMIKQTRV